MRTLRPYQQDAITKLKSALKSYNGPILVNASVGAGKSIIIAELLLWLQSFGYNSLCLTLNSTLIQQNANTYNFQGGECGIYCAGLDSKETEQLVIFASPHSVCQDIRNKGEISRKPFNVIIVDESHNINTHNPSSMFIRIMNHYGFMAQSEQYSFRVIGLTGTPYRDKSISIVGDDAFFKEEVVTIQLPWLIKEGFLSQPLFGKHSEPKLDFSKLRVNSMGRFEHSELESVISKDERLSGRIMREVVSIVESGLEGGAFIFCSTIRHVEECMRSLPSTAAAITGKTPHAERKRILEAANAGEIKYLVNVATLLVGVDVPRFSVAAFLRPTESLVLFNQAIGRVLRLFPAKSRSLILDYADNLSRFSDFDDPIINEALHAIETESELCIPCYTCSQLNRVTTRRCIGLLPSGKRCEHYFEWKDCHKCGVQNDQVSRHCRACDCELIDPNAKLRLVDELITVDVIRTSYQISSQQFVVLHQLSDGSHIPEIFYLGTRKALNAFYGSFVRRQVTKPSSYFMHLSNVAILKKMVDHIAEPIKLILDSSTMKIKRKIFCDTDGEKSTGVT